MWILFSLGAAFFAGITAIFAKIGVEKVDSSLATAIRTIIILVLSIIVVFLVGSFDEINKLDFKTTIFLVLSGISTSLLWLSYFKALQLGNINKVAPIDKTSIILTLILSLIFLNEKITIIKIVSMILILVGTVLMVGKSYEIINNKWIIYAIYTAIFTSLTTILGKIGINNVESNLGTLIRTIVVFIIIWSYILITKKQTEIKKITKKSLLFIILSGITTCFSWLCYFKALQQGEASLVFPIEKLSIVITVIISSIFLQEKINLKSILGLLFIIVGTLILII